MTLPVYTHPNLRIQYRRKWSDAWQWDRGTVAIGPFGSGGGNHAGSAEFTSIAADANSREAGALACPLRRGWFVRIVSKSASIQTVAGQKALVPEAVYWTGWIAGEQRASEGGTPERGQHKATGIEIVHWQGVCAAGMLATIDLHRVRHGCGTSDTSIRDMEGVLRFGRHRRPDNENRAGKRVLNPRNGWGNWNVWDLLTALLDWHLNDIDASGVRAQRFPHWPDFQIGGLTGALSGKIQDATCGGDLLSAIAAILHPRRGLFFDIVPPTDSAPSGPMTIEVSTFAQTPISIPQPGGDPLVIPANTNQTTLNGNAPHRRLIWQPAPPPRRLTLHGRRDVRIVSIRWSRNGGTEDGALTRGWASADDDKAGRTEAKYLHVFRTFAIRRGWTGTIKGTTAATLKHVPETLGTVAAPDALHGAGGLSGTMLAATTQPFPEYGIEFLDQLPMPSGATNVSGETLPLTDWLAEVSGAVLDQRLPPLSPMAFIHHRASGTWERLNMQISFPDAYTVQIGTGPKTAAVLRGKLSADTDDLVLTCAIVMPSILAVSHIPAVDDTAEILPSGDRKLDVDAAERIIVEPGTIFGLDAGAPTAPTVERSVRDDVGLLRSVLAMARLHAERSAGATYTDFADLSTDYRPGQLITQAEVREGIYQAIGYLITQVRHDPRRGDQAKTTITVETASIDMDIIP